MQRTAVSLFRIDWRQLGLVGLLLAIALIGWFLTDGRMAGMDAGPGTDPGTLGFYVSTWVVMMAAMMFPSMAPMVVAFARIQRRRRELGKASSGPAALVLFVGGYLVAWCLFGLMAYGMLKLVRSLSIDVLSWDRAGPYLAGAVIVAAAVYQLTPMKDVCLRTCRGPLDFLLGGWRTGYVGALQMGVEHGAWCVGCCWALMAALFAVGAMSVGWMAFIAALVAVEKMLPWQRVANRGVAILLLVLGLGVAFAPDRVPGLTVPGSPDAVRETMQMDGAPAQQTPPMPPMRDTTDR